MKKLLLLLFFMASAVHAEGPIFPHRDPQVQQEFENVYQDIRTVLTKNGNSRCIDDPTFCVDAVNNSVSIGSATITNLNSSSATITTLTSSSATVTNLLFPNGRGALRGSNDASSPMVRGVLRSRVSDDRWHLLAKHAILEDQNFNRVSFSSMTAQGDSSAIFTGDLSVVGVGGRDNTLRANTTSYFCGIISDGNGNFETMASTSPYNPTRPSGWPYWALAATIPVDASSAIINGIFIGNEWVPKTRPIIIRTAATSQTTVDISTFLPNNNMAFEAEICAYQIVSYSAAGEKDLAVLIRGNGGYTDDMIVTRWNGYISVAKDAEALVDCKWMPIAEDYPKQILVTPSSTSANRTASTTFIYLSRYRVRTLTQ